MDGHFDLEVSWQFQSSKASGVRKEEDRASDLFISLLARQLEKQGEEPNVEPCSASICMPSARSRCLLGVYSLDILMPFSNLEELL